MREWGVVEAACSVVVLTVATEVVLHRGDQHQHSAADLVVVHGILV